MSLVGKYVILNVLISCLLMYEKILKASQRVFCLNRSDSLRNCCPIQCDVKTKLPQIYNKNCVDFPTIVSVLSAGDQSGLTHPVYENERVTSPRNIIIHGPD